MWLVRVVNCKSSCTTVLNELSLLSSQTTSRLSGARSLIINSRSIGNLRPSNSSLLIYGCSNQRKWQSSSTKEAEILASTQSTGHNNKNENSKKTKTKLDSPAYRKFLLVFASGVITYMGISMYLNTKKNKPFTGAINYSSKHLPGQIKPSKSVSFYLYLIKSNQTY